MTAETIKEQAELLGINVDSNAKRRHKITKILYRNSTDDPQGMRIKFKNIETVIDQLNSLYD